MVSVDDLNPPEEAKIKTEPMGVHTGAPPKEALAERAGGVRGGLLSSLGGFVIRIRILMYRDVSCVYPEGYMYP